MRCRKVLKLKSEQNLLSDSWREIKRENILSDLSKSKYTYLNRTIADRSLILLKNRNNIIPLPISTKPTTLIAIGAERGGSKFASYLSRYSPIDTLVLDSKSSTSEIRNYITSKPNDINIIVSIHNTDQRPQKNYGLDNNTIVIVR
jgi:cephalosporin hydroxylase